MISQSGLNNRLLLSKKRRLRSIRSPQTFRTPPSVPKKCAASLFKQMKALVSPATSFEMQLTP